MDYSISEAMEIIAGAHSVIPIGAVVNTIARMGKVMNVDVVSKGDRNNRAI